MIWALVIFGAILVTSVIAHYFFWRSSQKHYEECMKQMKDLNERLELLAANDTEMDRMLDDAERDVEEIGKEIDALHSVWFMKGEGDVIDN